jgi:phosphatidylethanolamine-binding protein (PEBP) family uncharacterized protein
MLAGCALDVEGLRSDRSSISEGAPIDVADGGDGDGDGDGDDAPVRDHDAGRDGSEQTDAQVDSGPGLGAVLSSSAFVDGERLPDASTCAGQNRSPALAWTPGPTGTLSYALSLSALESNGQRTTQWVLWNIPADVLELAAGIEAGAEPSNLPGARQASFIVVPVDVIAGPRYRGPCSLRSMQFEFTLVALAVEEVPVSGQPVDPEAVVASIDASASALSRSTLTTSFP